MRVALKFQIAFLIFTFKLAGIENNGREVANHFLNFWPFQKNI